MSATTSDGKVIEPNLDGRFSVLAGSRLALNGAGFRPDSEVQVWLYSTPTYIVSVRADADGNVPITLDITDEMAAGDHHIVLNGTSYTGDDVTVSTPVTILGNLSESVIERVGSTVVWVLLVTALMIGLLIPTTLKRRSKKLHK